MKLLDDKIVKKSLLVTIHMINMKDYWFDCCSILIINRIGHVNASMGIGKLMVDRGHDVMFIHYPEHKSLAENQGIKFIDIFDYQEADNPLEKTHSGPFNDSSLETFDNQKKYSPKDLMRGGGGRGRGGNRGGGGRQGGGRGAIFSGENTAIENAMKVIKPDIILGDYRWPMGFMTSKLLIANQIRVEC